MIKTVTKIGNSKGIILDAALLELANLKEGDKLNITVHEGGAIMMVPDPMRIADDEHFKQSLDDVMAGYSQTLTKLS